MPAGSGRTWRLWTAENRCTCAGRLRGPVDRLPVHDGVYRLSRIDMEPGRLHPESTSPIPIHFVTRAIPERRRLIAIDSQPIDPGKVDYHEIARRGDTEVMEVFLEAGLPPDLQDHRGFPLLMIATYNDQKEMVDLLLESGAAVDAPDLSGNTPLMGVCFKGYEELGVHLLERGANPNVRNHSGATPLIMAAMFNRVRIARALLERGADATASGPQGTTALDIARSQNLTEMEELLATAGT